MAKKMKKPDKAKNPPKRITTPGKPGDSGPGGAHPGRNPPPRTQTEFERLAIKDAASKKLGRGN